jgi:hypothetical protein
LYEWICTPIYTGIDHNFGPGKHRVSIFANVLDYAYPVGAKDNSIGKVLGLFADDPDVAMIERCVMKSDQDLVFDGLEFFNWLN